LLGQILPHFAANGTLDNKDALPKRTGRPDPFIEVLESRYLSRHQGKTLIL